MEASLPFFSRDTGETYIVLNWTHNLEEYHNMMTSVEVLDEIHEALERGHRSYAIELFSEAKQVLSRKEQQEVRQQFELTKD